MRGQREKEKGSAIGSVVVEEVEGNGGGGK